jgi:tetratricopeptide (TPR) repeat protein
VAAESIGAVEDRLPDIHDQLRAEADALSIADEQQNVPQALFYEVTDIKRDHERSAMERRVAAWLYLQHRVGANRLDDSDPRRAQWQELGTGVAAELYQTGLEADKILALSIEEGLEVEIKRRVKLLRIRGDAYRKDGQEDKARECYRQAVAILEDELAELAAGTTLDNGRWAEEMADSLGSRGGLLNRLGELDQSLDSYQRGAAVETAASLTSTYNRANAIKLAIVAGRRTLSELDDDLGSLRRVLERRIATDERATDGAWLFADLGDVLLLLGDDAQAAQAYQAFAGKGQSSSPASTLSTIREVAAALTLHGDPAAERVNASLGSVQQVLGG